MSANPEDIRLAIFDSGHYHEDAKVRIEQLERELTESRAREAGLKQDLATAIEMLNEKSERWFASFKDLADSREREAVLRDSLTKFVTAATTSNEPWWIGAALASAHAALTQPAPPVVPKSIADGLAEALAEALDDMVNKASPLASHPHLASYVHHDSDHWQKARAALAAYRKEAAP